MSKVKLNTKITSFTDVQKSLQSIEKYLNELSKSVNAEAERDISDKDGKTGDIKTTRNADGTYTFRKGSHLIKWVNDAGDTTAIFSLRDMTSESVSRGTHLLVFSRGKSV